MWVDKVVDCEGTFLLLSSLSLGLGLAGSFFLRHGDGSSDCARQ